MQRASIVGAGGRMGKTLIEALAATSGCDLVGALTRPDSPDLGKDTGVLIGQVESGVVLTAELEIALTGADVVIDFSRPAVTLAIAEACVERNISLISGTTGLDYKQQAQLKTYSNAIAIVQAPNFSPGVFRLNRLIEVLARNLTEAGEIPDVEIIETHHKHKIDAPSGTALQIGQTAAAALGRNFKTTAQLDRQTHPSAKTADAIGFSSVRIGDAVGEHSIIFGSTGESLTITHTAYNRSAYADGAIKAAVWVLRQPPGLYGIADVMATD